MLKNLPELIQGFIVSGPTIGNPPSAARKLDSQSGAQVRAEQPETHISLLIDRGIGVGVAYASRTFVVSWLPGQIPMPQSQMAAKAKVRPTMMMISSGCFFCSQLCKYIR